MPAHPDDISRYTNDGVVLTAEDTALRDANPDAQGMEGQEVEMFYDSPADGQAMLNERFALLSHLSAIHEGIEFADDIGMGTDIPLAPNVPCFRVVDETRGVDAVVRTRAYVYEAAGDRYSVEVVE